MTCHQALLARKKKAAAMKANGSSGTATSSSTSNTPPPVVTSNSGLISSNPLTNLNQNNLNNISSTYSKAYSPGTANTPPSLASPNQSYPLNPSSSLPMNYTSTPNFLSRHGSNSFKEKSLPSLPNEEPPLNYPVAHPQASVSPTSIIQPTNAIPSSMKSVLSSPPGSSSPSQSPNSLSNPSPPTRPSQPAFDPALVRIPQRSQHASSNSRSVSISSEASGTSNNPNASPSTVPTTITSTVCPTSPNPTHNHSSDINTPLSSQSSTNTSLGQSEASKTRNSRGLMRSSSVKKTETIDSIRRKAKSPDLVPSIPLDSLRNRSNASASSNASRGGLYLDSSIPLTSSTPDSSLESGSFIDHNNGTYPSSTSSFSNSSSSENLSKLVLERSVLRSTSPHPANQYEAPTSSSSTVRPFDPIPPIHLLGKDENYSAYPPSSSNKYGLSQGLTINTKGPKSSPGNTTMTTPTQGHYRSASDNPLPTPTFSLKYSSFDDATTSNSISSSNMAKELSEARSRIAELEAQLSKKENTHNLENSIQEKRKTIAGLEAKGKVAEKELRALEEARNRSDSLNDCRADLVTVFTNEITQVKKSLQAEIENLVLERDKLVEETTELLKKRDSLQDEMNYLITKNNHLHDLHLELARQAVEKFGPYAKFGNTSFNLSKELSNGSNSSDHTRGIFSSGSNHLEDLDTIEDKKAHKGRFWKRPTAAMAKGVKGFNKVFQQDPQAQHSVHTISNGPYIDGSPNDSNELTNSSSNSNDSNDSNNHGNNDNQNNGNDTDNNTNAESYNDGTIKSSKQRNGWFRSGSQNDTTNSHNTHNNTSNNSATSNPSQLMGNSIENRIEYEGTKIPFIVTRCIQEVEERGIDMEGIYRKSGGRSQVSSIEEAFENMPPNSVGDDFNEILSGDISGVTSALKQYLRHLPNPLIPYEHYDSFVEASKSCSDSNLRQVINALPQAYKECLTFVIHHLAKVAQHSEVNLMTTRNLAVVFAPTLVRHTNGEREILDMQPRNDGTQMLIEKYSTIFSDVVITDEIALKVINGTIGDKTLTTQGNGNKNNNSSLENNNRKTSSETGRFSEGLKPDDSMSTGTHSNTSSMLGPPMSIANVI